MAEEFEGDASKRLIRTRSNSIKSRRRRRLSSSFLRSLKSQLKNFSKEATGSSRDGGVRQAVESGALVDAPISASSNTTETLSDDSRLLVSGWKELSGFRRSSWRFPSRKSSKLEPLESNPLLASLRGAPTPFLFQKRRARIDWRALHSIDVDQVIRETDIDKLESVLDTITFGDVQGEDTRNFSEANFIKLFRLSQLMGDRWSTFFMYKKYW
eukprot:c22195_g1_i1 orf=2071-2709(-)